MTRRMEVVRGEPGGWEMIRTAAAPHLAGYVREYQGFAGSCALLRHRAPPIREIVLVLGLGSPTGICDPRRQTSATDHRCFVAGLYDGFVITEMRGSFEGLEIRLSPIAAHRVFGVAMDELANRTLEIEDLLGAPARGLLDRLRDTTGWAQRFDLLDRFFTDRLERGRRSWGGVQHALRRLDATGGSVPIGELSSELGCSRKHLASEFRRQVGVPPKTFARIVRFNRVLERLAAGGAARWTEIAMECGYYDQAHFNREFRELAGTTPSEMLSAMTADGGISA